MEVLTALVPDLARIRDVAGQLAGLDRPEVAGAFAVLGVLADGKAYIGDEDGDIAVLKAGTKMELLHETNMGAAVYTTPVAKDGVIYVASRTKLFALEEGIPAKAAEKPAAGAR